MFSTFKLSFKEFVKPIGIVDFIIIVVLGDISKQSLITCFRIETLKVFVVSS